MNYISCHVGPTETNEIIKRSFFFPSNFWCVKHTRGMNAWLGNTWPAMHYVISSAISGLRLLRDAVYRLPHPHIIKTMYVLSSLQGSCDFLPYQEFERYQESCYSLSNNNNNNKLFNRRLNNKNFELRNLFFSWS